MRVRHLIAGLCACAAVSVEAAAQNYSHGGFRELTQSGYQDMTRSRTGEMPTVRDRFDGLGLRTGQFWVLPDIETGFFYDSNVFGESTGQDSSTGIYVSPNVEVRSDFGRHELNLRAGLDHFEYFDFPTQSHTDFDGEADGRYDISNDTALFGGLRGGRFHQNPGDLEYPVIGMPTSPGEYYRFETWGALEHNFNRLRVSVGAAFDLFDFNDVDGIDQDFRDGNIVTAGGRMSYLVSPGYRLFGDFRYNWRDYDGTRIAASDGWRGLGGVEFEVTRLISGALGLGYVEQTYDLPGSPTTSAFSYHGALLWNPTPLMTVRLDADRTIEDSTIDQTGRIQDAVLLQMDYEIMRTLILSPAVGMSWNDYTNTPLEDFRLEAGAELEYKMNRFISVGSRYKYSYTDNTGPAVLDWDRHLVGVYAKARF